MGLEVCARMVRVPGTPGTARSDRSSAARDGHVHGAGFADSFGEAGDVDLDRDLGAVDLLVGEAGACSGVRVGAGVVAGAGDRGGAGGVSGGGLDGPVGGGGAAAEDDQPDEQDERRQPDDGLDRGRARSLDARVMVRSTVRRAAMPIWRDVGDQPGMTLRLRPRTVTETVVAERVAVARDAVRTSRPPASAMNAVAAVTPSDSRPCLAGGGAGAFLGSGDRHGAGVVEQARPACPGTSPRTGQAAG